MRILLPIIQFPPDVNPTGLLMAQLCEGLAACGHEISVITGFPHYENFRVWDEYRGKLVEHGRYGAWMSFGFMSTLPEKKPWSTG